MRKPEHSSEPSIEEILASIRKIIAEDSTQQPVREAAIADEAPDPALRQFNQEAHRQAPYTPPAFYAEPEEPAAAMGEDDILELTEDSMLEEVRGQAAMGFADEPAGAETYDPEPVREGVVAVGRSAPPSGEELESVLSSVVAEVKRLAEAPKPDAEHAALSMSDWTEPPRRSALSSPRKPPVVERWDSPVAQPEIAPAPPAAPPSARQPQQSRPASKPVWSARHLDGEAPRTRAPQPAETRQRDPSASSLRAMSGPEGWADGFQMPVPENGPATPFPEPETDDDMDIAPPLTGSGETHAEIEKEKTFVGEMLTRVFGGVPKKGAEPSPPSPAAPQLAKAEDLAKATIADFASEKLRAPAVAQALHADKPFMDAITNSLETAMADRNAAAERRATEHPSSPDDEAPELPADDESEAYDAPVARQFPAPAPAGGSTGDLLARRLAAASQYAAPSVPEPPEMPRDLPEDLLPPEITQGPRQAAAEIPRASAAPQRAAAVASAPPPPVPARAAPKPEPRVNAAAPQTATPAPDGLAFSPALEDSIKELIKPLIVQWLNDNLPRIVEKAVREEIADQGLVSRARGESGSRR